MSQIIFTIATCLTGNFSGFFHTVFHAGLSPLGYHEQASHWCGQLSGQPSQVADI